jgi:hypothetical protein
MCGAVDHSIIRPHGMVLNQVQGRFHVFLAFLTDLLTILSSFLAFLKTLLFNYSSAKRRYSKHRILR